MDRVKSAISHEKTDSQEKREENNDSVEKSESDEKVTETKSKSDEKVKSSPSSTGIVGFSNDRFSIEIVWNPKSVANYFMEQIRAFNKRKGKKDDK